MAVLEKDLILYGSANHQETDSGTQGGAIDKPTRLVFEELSAGDSLDVVSDNAGDTSQTVTITGKNAGGDAQAQTPSLNGVTIVNVTGTWERILKAVKSATCAGNVAVMRDTRNRSNTAQGGADSTVSVMAYITLDTGASAVDGYYKNMVLRTTGGTGPNQIRRVVKYLGASKRAYVHADWGTEPDATTTFDVAEGLVFEKTPNEVLTIRRPFYDVAADAEGGSARNYYEKVHFSNEHGTLSLTSATIIEQTDPSGNVDFGLENSANDTSTNRITAPTSVTFNSSTKAISNIVAGGEQAVWLHLALPAGEAPAKTSYTLRCEGTTI